MHFGLDPQRVSEVMESLDIADIEFEDESVVAMIESIDTSQPSGGFFKENPQFCHQGV